MGTLAVATDEDGGVQGCDLTLVDFVAQRHPYADGYSRTDCVFRIVSGITPEEVPMRALVCLIILAATLLPPSTAIAAVSGGTNSVAVQVDLDGATYNLTLSWSAADPFAADEEAMSNTNFDLFVPSSATQVRYYRETDGTWVNAPFGVNKHVGEGFEGYNDYGEEKVFKTFFLAKKKASLGTGDLDGDGDADAEVFLRTFQRGSVNSRDVLLTVVGADGGGQHAGKVGDWYDELTTIV